MTDELLRLTEENKQLTEQVVDLQNKLKSRLQEMLNLKDLLIKRQDDLIDSGKQITHLLQELEQYKVVIDEIKIIINSRIENLNKLIITHDLSQKEVQNIKQILSKLGDNA